MSTELNTQRPRPDALGAALLFAVLATTAACASPVGAGSPPPATEMARIAVSGSVPAQLVSAEGPTTDGVFVGHSVAALLHGMQRADHGFLSCAPRRCWQGRQLPAHSIGVAFQANPLGCEQVDSVRVSSSRSGSIRFAVQAHPVCTRGGGAAAKGMTILVAVPQTALPRSGALTARVDLAMRPGDEFKPLGSASTPL